MVNGFSTQTEANDSLKSISYKKTFLLNKFSEQNPEKTSNCTALC